MPTSTYVALATETLSGTATNVTFSSIPATYRDLILVIDGTASASNTTVIFRLNGDTGSNYSYVWMYGTGSGSPVSNAGTDDGLAGGALSNTQSSITMQLFDYSATDKHKSALIRRDMPSSFVLQSASRWANTDAVTSITAYVDSPGETLQIGTTLSLYGIAS